MSELSLLSESDRSQILDAFNATDLEYGYGSSIVDCFSAVAADYGDRVAIRDGETSFTYKELDVLSNQLAHYLLSNHQIGLDDLVGVKLERGSWLLVSLLGILKSGGAYVPIDSGYPADRIAHIESDSGCKITIDPSFIASFRDAVSDLPTDLPSVVINPDTLSYVMYTSGSTGMPKGVMITHDNVVSLSKSCDYIPLDTDTVWLSTGSVSFDATTIEFWGTLLNGGCLILSDMDSLLDSSSLGNLIDTHKVTTLWMTASWFHQVVEEDLSIFSGLSYLLVGGDKVLYKYTNRIKEAYPDLKLLNGYGPTENTTFSTTHTILGDQDQDLPIGKPIKNSTAYILGDSLEVLPVGVVGELCLGGSGLARGYLNREELTSEKFIAHPFKEGERIYKTGDLARWLPDGSIAFVGRKDDQVKIRGYRIELGEIESVLHDVSGVVQGVVQVTTDAQGVKRLVGYVVVEADLDREGIISGLSERLPDYMIPQLWVLLDSLPLNRNGKVDKKSLPNVDVSELQGVEYVAPQTVTEVKLSQYWSELLGVERVGIEDDFFVLGGHSLLATRVATYIRGEFEVDIRIRDLFSYTRLVDLCSYIDSLEKSSVVSIGNVERPERIPLSFAQERLWFIDQLEQGSSSYHMPGVFEISGVLDKDVLVGSINKVINRHEVLRTVYKQEDGVAYQEVLPEDQWRLEQTIKIDGLSKEAIDTLIDKEIARPFDLSSDHMLRVTLLEEEGKAKLLIFNMHHIASDGWSHPILLEELLGYYRSELKGEALALADLPIQYADYSIWQREYLSGDRLATQLGYWRDTLSGVSPLELPLDYVRPKEQSMAGDSLSFDLSSDILAGLKAISKAKGSTLFMTLLSAFKVLMYRYSGQDDICIGTPIANREQEEVSGLIGFFVNTLALRSDLSGNPSFEALLAQVKDTTLSAYEHQQVPFEKIVSEVVRDRDMSRSPLFQVMFALQNNEVLDSDTSQSNDGFELEEYDFGTYNTKFDLNFNAVETEEGITLRVEYCTDLFKAETIQDLVEHFELLLNSILIDPSTEIGNLRMLSAEESDRLLYNFNETTFDFDKDQTITDLFSTQVAKTPDNIALVFEDRELTYKQLDELSNQFANYLKSQNDIQSEDMVGILLDRSEWMMISILAILKSGGTYVPVDRSYPQDRIDYLLSDSSCKMCIDESAISAFIETQKDFSKQFTATASISSSNLAYVIYTSGTTGKPKGVMIEQRSLVSRLLFYKKFYALDTKDTTLFYRSFSFDGTLEEYMLPLTIGMKCMIASPDFKFDLQRNFVSAIEQHQVTLVKMPPALLHELLETLSEEDISRISCLRHIISGGDKLPLQDYNKFSERIGSKIKANLYNSYGPTENTINSTIHKFEKDTTYHVVPIGRPIGNSSVYILDENNNLQPFGFVGELCVGGVGLSRGYLNKEELTKEKFIAHPFIDGERIYKTGDLARWLPDGSVQFIGRKDSQVKIRGYRIELGEIESVLQEVEGINQGVIVVKEDGIGNNFLAGYIVAETDFDREKIVALLKSRLPEYMVPQLWVPLDEMPLTSNGKIDRKSLSKAEIKDVLRVEYTEPESELEITIATYWQELLKVEKVGVDDDFFALGGHSLLATRVTTFIRSHCNVDIRIKDIFRYTTIRNLATYIETLEQSEVSGIKAEERPEFVPLSFAQERLWFIDKLEEGSASYHMPGVFEISGTLDRAVLERAINRIVNRHEVLRTIYKEQNGVTYQEVMSEDLWSFEPTIDISEITSEELENTIDREINRSFNLSKDHMLRVTLLENEGVVKQLIFNIHHIASDGWSQPILLEELLSFYRGELLNEEVNLPSLPVQYADYSIWQREYLSGNRLKTQLGYWKNKLSGVKPLELPLDFARPKEQSLDGNTLDFTLDRSIVNKIKELSKEQGVTMFMTLLSAFKVLMYRYSGQEDICIGTPIANREQEEVAGLIGFFINALALRSDLSGNPSFEELLAQVKDTTLEAYEYQQVPFEKIVNEVVKQRDMSRSPLFQVMFVLQNNEESEIDVHYESEGFELEQLSFDRKISQFDLKYSAREDNGDLQITIEYCIDLFTQSTVERMFYHYEELLQSVLTNSTHRIDELSILLDDERDLILGRAATVDGDWFNADSVDLGNDRPINVRFEDIAATYETSVAVVHNDQVWNYKELNEYANRLGHLLRNLGVTSSDCVGVYLDRCPEFLGCLMGIIKSGGIYTPLDTQNPSHRIGLMLSKPEMTTLITTSEFLATLEDIPQSRIILVDKCSNELRMSYFNKRNIIIRDQKDLSSMPVDNVENQNRLDSWAYVLYTSGSTGEPKGAITRHDGAMNHILAEYELMNLPDDFRFLQSAGIGSDISVWQMLGPVLKGGACVIVDKYDLLDYNKLLQIITEHQVSLVEFVPTYMWGLLEHIKNISSGVALPDLDWVMLVGESIPPMLINELKRLYPNMGLVNGYGPCEASDDVIQYEILEALPSNHSRVPIGKVIQNMNAVILDKQGNLCPIGVIGEICVSGVGVGAGYLGLPERTAQSFIANPFEDLLGDVMYKTGDLGRWLPDGNMEFIGRSDNQVKIRGHRVELEEIASCIRKDNRVSDCHVMVYKADDGQEYLLSFVVLNSVTQETSSVIDELRELCKGELPAYMHPSHYMIVDEMPINLSDKVDGKKLLSMFLAQEDLGGLGATVYVAPQTATEVKLSQYWSELLGVERVGIEDDFFVLGGHSLLATRVATYIRGEFEVDIRIRDLFSYTRLVDLCSYIDSLEKSSVVSIGSVERPKRIPLSFAQERLWFIDQLEQGSSSYHMPGVFEISGVLDKDVLVGSVNKVINRHEVLRTVYKQEDGIAYQEVMPEDQWRLEKNIKIDGLSKEAIDTLIDKEIARPFDLSSDHMLRVTLLEEEGKAKLLIFNMHHIASDGWSHPILLEELLGYYRSALSGEALELPLLPIQYADYSIWQREYLSGDRLEAQLGYWRDTLSGVSPLELPLDYVRPKEQSMAGDSLSFDLSADILAGLKEISKDKGSTLFMTLLSAFKVLMYRYSGQDDICIGTPIANREQEEVSGLIGFFVNTLALRSDLSGNPSFEALLAQVKDTTLSAYEHQQVPFEKIVSEVVRDRDMSRSPLFQVMFALQNNEVLDSDTSQSNDGFELEEYGFGGQSAKFEMTVSMAELEDGLGLTIGYCTDLFKAETITRLVAHFEILLRSIISDTSQAIGALKMLSAREEQEVVFDFNQTEVGYAADQTILDVFSRQVAAHPDKVALVYKEEELTYRELDELSNQLAHCLRSQGVSLGSGVGILFRRSTEMIVSILGVLKSGGVYVPLDPTLPLSRLSYIQEDADLSCIVSNDRDLYNEIGLDASLYLEYNQLTGYPVSGFDFEGDITSSAYVMYTSGTTGRPKGIEITQGNILTLIYDQGSIVIREDDRVLQWSNYAFDGSTYEIFGSLLSGASLYMISESEAPYASELSGVFKRYDITVSFMTTALFNSFVDYDVDGLSGVRKLLFGGELVSVPHVERALSALGSDRLIHVYGPTETTVFATYYPIDSVASLGVTVPIGYPLSNMQTYILGDSLEVLPVGVVGELCLGGSGLARGYLNREELTSEKFIAHPFKEGERIYKTGDLARWLPDGSIAFVGRKDDQVKIRGYRIELGEIESVLHDVSGVVQGVVQVTTDAQGVKRLVGYVVVEADLDREGIISGLSERLPDYMIPQLWVLLDSLPLNRNGKVDKKSLPNVDVSELQGVEYVAPQTVTEVKLSQYWSELLGVERVGIEDDFFVLGGHSLLATRVATYIRGEFEVDIRIRDLFSYTRLVDLCSYIDSLEKSSVVSIGNVERPERIPLSFAQERLWFIDQLEQGSSSYHMPGVFEISGVLDKDVLVGSINKVINRHEVLRTVYKQEDGVAYQEVLPEDQWRLEQTIKIDGLSKEAIDTLIDKEIARPFDLSSDHMLRVTLLEEEGKAKLLIFNMHHIASDGWSHPILLEELLGYYRSALSGETLELPLLPIQYADYSIWQREYLSGDRLATQLGYWRDTLSGVSPLELPLDYVRPKEQSMAGDSLSFDLSSDILEGLKAISKDKGSTLFMTLLSAFKVLMYRYSGQDDICIGTPIANREQEEVSGLIGFFVNTLALRSDLSGNPSFEALLAQVKDTTLSAYEHQQVPFEKIVSEVVRDRDMSRSPLFQVMFALQNNEVLDSDTSQSNDGFELEEYGFGGQSAKFEMTVSMAELEDGLGLTIGYCTDLFKAETITRLVAHFEILLRSIISDTSQAIGALKMLSAREEQEVVFDFNQTEVGYATDQTILDVFSRQVAAHPDKVALVYKEEELTYRELDELSNQLAHCLRSQGVSLGSGVGILFRRSTEMIVSILGVLKSGGMYVPLDPTLPLSRLSYIQEDADLSCIVSNDIDLYNEIGLDASLYLEYNQFTGYPVSGLDFEGDITSSAYVMYTSGTTGRPKGIEITQENILTLIYDQGSIVIREDDRVLQWSNYAFDGSTYEIFGSLLSGASLYMISESEAPYASELSGVFKRYDITVSFMTTALFNSFVDYDVEGLSGVRKLLFGGELVSVPHVERALSALGSDRLIHVYGPTETTVFATYYPIDSVASLGVTVPIGYPLSNMQTYILGDSLEVLPVGVVGELCLGGSGLARGYLNREELTSEKFIAHPFKEGERLYKTGDLARWLPDGSIAFVGRKDDQVKIRGYRIELGEIESVLHDVAGVVQGVVQVTTDAQGVKRLVGYVVVEADLDREGIISGLSERLPDYMIPQLWVLLDSLPLNRNGKVDKKSLPNVDVSDLQGVEYVAPQTVTEVKLSQYWSELLGVERVGIEDDFFVLGGHSLLATRVATYIRGEFEVDIRIRDLFSYTRLVDLCSYIDSLEKSSVVSIGSVERPKRIPLSFAQERLWFIDQLEQGSSSYHMPGVFEISGVLDKDVLVGSINKVINRHEVLRTVYKQEDGVAYQEVLPEDQWRLEQTIKIDGLSKEAIDTLIDKEITRPFDLSSDHMLRVTLLEEEGKAKLLIFNMHHIASDGWSHPILLEELLGYYRSELKGEALALADLPIQYADYSIWQREYLSGDRLATQLGYWRDTLSGVSPLELPLDYVRPKEQSMAGDSLSFDLSSDILEGLKAISKDKGSTLFMTLLSAFKVLMYRYSGQDDICIGTPIANREQEEVSGLIGFFVNTLALRSDLSGNPSFEALLAQVKDTTLSAYEHQQVPFEKIVSEVVRDRDMSRSPLFQVMFALQNNEVLDSDTSQSNDGFELEEYGFGGQSAKFEMTVSMAELEDGLGLTIGYCTDLFKAETITRLVAHFEILLRSIISDTSQAIGALKMLSAREEQEVVFDFNQTEVGYATDQTILDVFSRQVAAHPDKVALVYKEEELTYRELDELSNQLAHCLRSQGVSLGSGVGILFRRSTEMIVSILGVLKSGGMYVPLDPTLPLSRLSYIQEDADLSCIVSNDIDLYNEIGLDASLYLEYNQFTGYPVSGLDFEGDITSSAYVMYTSGTTGRPKGIEITQENILTLIYDQGSIVIREDDRVLQWSNYAFDGSTYEIFGSLLSGASLYMISESEAPYASELSGVFKRYDITVSFMTTALFNSFVDYDVEGLSGVRKLLFGGELVSVPHVERALSALGSDRLIHVYGPTETTVFATYYPIDSVASLGVTVPIGYPLSNMQTYILGDSLEVLPVGVVGELCLGGSGLARGYLNREELTSEKFIAHPFKEGERII